MPAPHSTSGARSGSFVGSMGGSITALSSSSGGEMVRPIAHKIRDPIATGAIFRASMDALRSPVPRLMNAQAAARRSVHFAEPASPAGAPQASPARVAGGGASPANDRFGAVSSRFDSLYFKSPTPKVLKGRVVSTTLLAPSALSSRSEAGAGGGSSASEEDMELVDVRPTPPPAPLPPHLPLPLSPPPSCSPSLALARSRSCSLLLLLVLSLPLALHLALRAVGRAFRRSAPACVCGARVRRAGGRAGGRRRMPRRRRRRRSRQPRRALALRPMLPPRGARALGRGHAGKAQDAAAGGRSRRRLSRARWRWGGRGGGSAGGQADSDGGEAGRGAKRSSVKVLVQWNARFKRSSRGEMGVIVEGFLVDPSGGARTAAALQWRTSFIVERETATRVKTASGSLYVLQGAADLASGQDWPLPVLLLKRFAHGFPADFQDLVAVADEEASKAEALAALEGADSDDGPDAAELAPAGPAARKRGRPKKDAGAGAPPAKRGRPPREPAASAEAPGRAKAKGAERRGAGQSAGGKAAGKGGGRRQRAAAEAKEEEEELVAEAVEALATSRSGRKMQPPREFWRGQAPVYHDGALVAVSPGKRDALAAHARGRAAVPKPRRAAARALQPAAAARPAGAAPAQVPAGSKGPGRPRGKAAGKADARKDAAGEGAALGEAEAGAEGGEEAEAEGEEAEEAFLRNESARRAGGGAGGWSAEEQAALSRAYRTVAPDAADFWEQVARGVPGRAPEECFAQHARAFPTPAAVARRARKRPASPAVLDQRRSSVAGGGDALPRVHGGAGGENGDGGEGGENSGEGGGEGGGVGGGEGSGEGGEGDGLRVAGLKGTNARKREVRHLLARVDREHADDIFESTPFKTTPLRAISSIAARLAPHAHAAAPSPDAPSEAQTPSGARGPPARASLGTSPGLLHSPVPPPPNPPPLPIRVPLPYPSSRPSMPSLVQGIHGRDGLDAYIDRARARARVGAKKAEKEEERRRAAAAEVPREERLAREAASAQAAAAAKLLGREQRRLKRDAARGEDGDEDGERDEDEDEDEDEIQGDE